MERNRQHSFKKRPNPNFKRGGNGNNKRGKFGEQSSENSQNSETVYRILCPSRKIGSVIGKGGGIVKSLREETQAKITVAESVPGSEERIIIINSPSSKLAVNNNENNGMELHCAAQDALLKVHDRIVAEDIIDVNETVVIARMLVPNNTVGCVLGKKGDVIQRLRSETGASIRVMPADQLPTCAMNTDELLQISAIPAVAKNALHQISTLLHQNPRKDKPPSSFHSGGGHGSNRGGPTMEAIPPMSFLRPDPRGPPQLPWGGGHSSEPARFGRDGFDGQDTRSEFSMKILCPALKIGGVIGKAGMNVRQLQQETGTNIHVDDAIGELDERVIRVSAIEDSRNPRSQTIDAIFFLQDKTCEHNEKGIITTRLLLPSSKVGCLIGQGGQVINEMRKRTRADIRVYSKEEKPRCAGEDEELVQVSGSYGVCKDALGEIASRFRARCFRDAKPGAGPEPTPGPAFLPRGNLPTEGPPASGVMRGGRLGGYESFKGGHPAPVREYEPRVYIPPPHEYEPHGFPVPSHAPAPAPGYPGAADVKMPNSGAMGPGVHNEVPGTRGQQPYDPYAAVGAEAVGDVYQGYGGQNMPVVSYSENYGTEHGSFPNINSSFSSSHTPYHTATTNPPYPGPVPVPPQQAQAQVQAHYPESSYQYGQ